jgi:hypothetical protein
MGQGLADERAAIRMNPETVLGEFHPRLLSVALTGGDVEGSVEEFQEVMHKLDEPHRRKRDALDAKTAVIREQVNAGKAVAAAIQGVPGDYDPYYDQAQASPVGFGVPSSLQVDALQERMSVKSVPAALPHEIQFDMPTRGKLPVWHDDWEPGPQVIHRYVHLEAMPPELQAVVKNYLNLTKATRTFQAGAMRLFKESAFELATSIAAADKKKLG